MTGREFREQTKQDKRMKQKQMIMQRDMDRARLAEVLPCLGQMKEQELCALGLNPAAVAEVTAGAGKPSMHGISTGNSLSGMQVVAQKGIERFYELLAPIDAFSTTYMEDYVVSGRPGVLPKLEVPVYDDTDVGEEDNYSSFATRVDGGKVSGAEVTLHKRDKVITIYARDIQQGVDLEKRITAAMSSLARGVLESIFQRLAVETPDIEGNAIEALGVPLASSFDFELANRELSEAIQPRVHGMLLRSDYYGRLKPADKDGLGPKDLDVDLCAKVEGLDKLGTNAVGLLANRRGAAVGLAAPYMMQGAYASYEQVRHAGLNAPIGVATWFDPNENCIKVWLGVLVGVAVTDARAVKVLTMPR